MKEPYVYNAKQQQHQLWQEARPELALFLEILVIVVSLWLAPPQKARFSVCLLLVFLWLTYVEEQSVGCTIGCAEPRRALTG